MIWVLVFAVCCLVSGYGATGDYEANWASLDTRPLPGWYDEAKVGIFIHWGVFSVPSFRTEWFWYEWKGKQVPEFVDFMNKNYKPGFTYPEFAPMFTAEFFDPVQWAKTFNASGARYVVLTSKHHEGFANWPSKYSWNWNSMDVGPKQDLVGELACAIRSTTPHIRYGLYHSLYEWFNPTYLEDKNNNFQTNNFIKRKVMPELLHIVSKYRPEIVWSDGCGEAPDWYWNSTVFLAWLFNSSPVKETVVVNDRWGSNIRSAHGSFRSHSDKFNPGELQDHKWEDCLTLDKVSWGYRRNAVLSEYLTAHEVITELTEVVSCGGNFLINIGPTHDGMLPAIMEERLLQMGEWLNINGEAIYSSTPWVHQKDALTPKVWYTSVGASVYAITLSWPLDEVLTLSSVRATADTVITMLGDSTSQTLQISEVPQGLEIILPSRNVVTSRWAWVLKMTGVEAVHTDGGDDRNQF